MSVRSKTKQRRAVSGRESESFMSLSDELSVCSRRGSGRECEHQPVFDVIINLSLCGVAADHPVAAAACGKLYKSAATLLSSVSDGISAASLPVGVHISPQTAVSV